MSVKFNLARAKQVGEDTKQQGSEESDYQRAYSQWRMRCDDLLTRWAQGTKYYLRECPGARRLGDSPAYDDLFKRAEITRDAWIAEAGCTNKNSLAAVPIILNDRICISLLVSKHWLPVPPERNDQPRPLVSNDERLRQADSVAEEWLK